MGKIYRSTISSVLRQGKTTVRSLKHIQVNMNNKIASVHG